jgi:hypothetical protein
LVSSAVTGKRALSACKGWAAIRLWAVGRVFGADTICTSVASAGRAGVTLRALRCDSSAASIIAADSLATWAWKDRSAEIRRADTSAISARNEVAIWIISTGLNIIIGEGGNAEEIACSAETVETLNRSASRAGSDGAVSDSGINADTSGTHKWSGRRATIGKRAISCWCARSIRAENGTIRAGEVNLVGIARREFSNTDTIRAFKWSACRAAIYGEIASGLISDTEAIRALEAEVRWASEWPAFGCIWSAGAVVASDSALWADVKGSAGSNRGGASHVRTSDGC